MAYFEQLFSLVLFFSQSIILSIIFVGIGFIFGVPKSYFVKNSAYECGFKPFSFGYVPYDVQFYRIGILFLLLDVEVLFLFPWAANFYKFNCAAHVGVFLFLLILFSGFIYELKRGVLTWYPQP